MATRFRMGAAVAGISIAAMTLAAAPAGADDVTASVLVPSTWGYRANVNGVEGDPQTKLFDLKLSNGAVLKVYCVQIWENLNHDENAMVEVPWGDYPNPSSPFVANSAKINWLLHHGYPARSLTDLAATLTAGGATLYDGLSEQEAITATQAAAWHFSDDTQLNRDNTLLDSDDEGTESDVLAFYDYLTGPANTGQAQGIAPTLELTPGEKTGASGDRIGPFTVSTTGKVTELLANVPAGVRITDKDGTELTAATIKDGTEIYFDIPADAAAGAGTVKLTASALVPTGRLFVGKDGRRAQSLIVAQSNTATLTADAKAGWKLAPVTTTTTPPSTTTTVPPATTTTTTAAPVPQASAGDEELANTGVSILVPIGIGTALLAAGIAAMRFQRRRSA
ncbi:thioester domain-containing protein [Actinophytocola sp.]|uniref:thioester domain-containing protein n=1 Tax=Actinophytocola sp. TaxID=1872138 RepID=UPI0039C88368